MLLTDEVVRVTVGEAWYDLRAQIGWYAQRQVDDTRYVVRLDGNIGINKAERDLARLKTRLLAWSWPEPLSEAAIKRLAPWHARTLIGQIEALEQAEAQLGVQEPAIKNSPSA